MKVEEKKTAKRGGGLAGNEGKGDIDLSQRQKEIKERELQIFKYHPFFR